MLAQRGELDSAIQSYEQAIKSLPSYTAAHHDLAIAYQSKMGADPDNWQTWCQRALAS